MTETRFPMETRPQLSPGPLSPHPDHSARPPTPSRQEFEAERKPDLRRDVYLQDIHCVSSLCKAYFRELPDPLLTYRLYDKFAVRRGPGRGTGCCQPRCSQAVPDRGLAILKDGDGITVSSCCSQGPPRPPPCPLLSLRLQTTHSRWELGAGRPWS